MSNLPNPEEILLRYTTILTDGTKICSHHSRIKAMKEYGRQIRDKTLDYIAGRSGYT